VTDRSSSPRASRWEGIRLYLIGLALLGAIPLIAVEVYRIASRGAELERDLGRDALSAAHRVVARIDERVRSAEGLMLGVSSSVVPSLGAMAHNDSILKRTFAKAAGHFGNIVVLDSSGTVVGSALDNPRILRTPGAYGTRGYFSAAKRRRGFVVGDAFRSQVLPDSDWVVVLAMAITDSNGKFTGAVTSAIRLDSLIDVVPPGRGFPAPPLITVFDTSGMIVARSERQDEFVGHKGFRAVSVDTEGTSRYKGFDGRERLTSFARAQSAPWLVNVGIEQSVISSQVARMLLQDLALLVVAIGLTVLVGYRVGQRITRPIEALADDARAITRGAIATRAGTTGPREVGLLGEAFNQMAETIERRNASLEDSERRHRLLFDSNPLPMWAWDAETMLISAVNEAALQQYGYTRDEFLSLRIVDLLDESERPRFQSARLPFAEARQSAGTWQHRTASGERVEMEVVTTSSRRLGRPSWLSVGIDVTARRAAERALALSEEQLRQSQKMEAIGAFAGGISHDFNNLLTGVLGYCDLALGDAETSEAVQADLREIRALALRGADLTRQILAVSRKQVVQPVILDPNDVVRGVDRLLQRLIGEHIVLDITLGAEIGTIHADAGQLEQVLLNLCANARDAMPTGGRLRIATERATRAVLAAEGLDVERSWLQLSVSDTGSGMTEEVRQRVFEPFFTTKERGKGTGLGLSLAYATVDQSGGAIRVDSRINFGTAFRLFFPMVVGVTTIVREDLANEMRDGEETILIAEDEDSVRAVAAAALERHGYRVLTARDGESALQVAREFPDTIDLLLTDVVMPKMNGHELATRMSQLRPDLRVLFASGYTDDASLLRGIRTDELSFLQKPFTAVDLLRHVRSVLDHPVRAA
jgi:PAS domain S-box-containing protein